MTIRRVVPDTTSADIAADAHVDVSRRSIVLTAGHVVLRPMRDEDVEPLVGILEDPEVMKWALYDRPLSRTEALRFISEAFVSDVDMLGMHVVSEAQETRAIGFSGFRKCALLGSEDVEFGWVLAEQFHGRGFATAIGQALIGCGLTRLGLRRVLAACHPSNVVSEHILRDKLKMTFVADVEPQPSRPRRVYCAALE